MKVMQVNTNNYNPQFRRIQVGKGGREILGWIAETRNYEGLKRIFEEASENHFADIYIGSDGIKVIDCLSKEVFLPSGKLLQELKTDKAWFMEAELLPESSKQVYPFGETNKNAKYLYIENKIIKNQRLFSEAKQAPVFFRPKKPDSYVIRQDNRVYGSSYFTPDRRKELQEVGIPAIDSVRAKIEAARHIAFNIMYYADSRTVIPDTRLVTEEIEAARQAAKNRKCYTGIKDVKPVEVSPATEEFVDELINNYT